MDSNVKRPISKIIEEEDLKNSAVNVFKEHEEIKLGYLHGSYAKNRQDEFSDIDIGIVIERDFNEPPSYFEQIASSIEENFNYTINIDLRILNDLPPRFLFRVINEGKLIYFANRLFKDEFEVKVFKEYLDLKQFLNFFDNQYIKEVLRTDD